MITRDDATEISALHDHENSSYPSAEYLDSDRVNVLVSFQRLSVVMSRSEVPNPVTADDITDRVLQAVSRFPW